MSLSDPTHARKRLPNRRESVTFTIKSSGGHAYVATVSLFENGDLGEIFLSGHKTGTDTDVAARDAAITCSIALQYGAPVDVIRKALCRDARGAPNGPLAIALDLLAGEGAA